MSCSIFQQSKYRNDRRDQPLRVVKKPNQNSGEHRPLSLVLWRVISKPCNFIFQFLIRGKRRAVRPVYNFFYKVSHISLRSWAVVKSDIGSSKSRDCCDEHADDPFVFFHRPSRDLRGPVIVGIVSIRISQDLHTLLHNALLNLFPAFFPFVPFTNFLFQISHISLRLSDRGRPGGLHRPNRQCANTVTNKRCPSRMSCQTRGG